MSEFIKVPLKNPELYNKLQFADEDYELNQEEKTQFEEL